MTLLDETTCLYALHSVLGHQPEAADAIIRTFGSAQSFFNLPIEEIKPLFRKGSRIPYQINPITLQRAWQSLKEAEGLGYEFIGKDHPDYPPLLKDCPDCPVGIFQRPERSRKSLSKAILIVDEEPLERSRKTLRKKLTENLLSKTESIEFVVADNSGKGLYLAHELLSYGAHVTIIPENDIVSFSASSGRRERDELISRRRASVISDCPIGTYPRDSRPHQCRIASGMSLATVLFSCPKDGIGTTCSLLADSYNRQIYALPGRIIDKVHGGGNLLLATRKAEIVISMEWLAEELLRLFPN